jgi:hypothetical protein
VSDEPEDPRARQVADELARRYWALNPTIGDRVAYSIGNMEVTIRQKLSNLIYHGLVEYTRALEEIQAAHLKLADDARAGWFEAAQKAEEEASALRAQVATLSETEGRLRMLLAQEEGAHDDTRAQVEVLTQLQQAPDRVAQIVADITKLRAERDKARRALRRIEGMGDEAAGSGPWRAFYECRDIARAALGGQPRSPWVCKARRSNSDPPQDCDWPWCGCDPAATKVIDALIEQGRLRE